jgi:O-antigen/teichoic acid export membrane protein
VPLIILTFGQFINGATGSVGFLLQMTGKGKLHRNNLFFGTLIGLVFSAVSIPRYGAVGAAYGTFLALSLTNVMSWYIVKRELSINTLKPW